MYIDRCGGRREIKGQWLFATLGIGRMGLLSFGFSMGRTLSILGTPLITSRSAPFHARPSLCAEVHPNRRARARFLS